jgi:glycosyltransferase involved in cell wall biosynthesis
MIKQPKLLFIAESGNIGGTERVLIEIVRFVQDNSFVPIVITPCDGNLKRELESYGIKVLVKPLEWWITPKGPRKWWRLYMYLEGLPKRVREIAKILCEEDIAIVHSINGLTIEGALAAKITGRPHVWHHHNIYSKDPGFDPWMPNWFIPYVFHALSDVLVCCSNFTARELFPPHLRQKVQVIYNPIDILKLNPIPPQQDLREELCLPFKTPLVGMLGRVHALKGQLEFIEAAARVREVIPNAHFLLAGTSDDTYLKQVLRRIRQLNADNYIHYLGYRLDYVDILKSLDVYVLASKLENLSMVVLEAMACGKPVIATLCGGITEAMVDKETGFLVEVDDVIKMTDAMIDLLSRPDRGASLGIRGRERVTLLFDKRECLRSLTPIYWKLLGSSRNNLKTHSRTRISAYLVSIFLAWCIYAPKIYRQLRKRMRGLASLFWKERNRRN